MQPKINYQLELEKELKKIKAEGRRPRLLLHGCCAPCSSYVLEYLSEIFDITLFYYNPNIAPREEFERRAAEAARLIREMGVPVALQVARYEPELWREAVRGLENEPEGGRRCEACFRLRLNKTAQAAKEGGYDYFTTTLSISPLKDAQLLCRLGGELSQASGVPYLYSDFKKKGGYQRSIELSRIYSLYRQDYCGCAFSRAERERKKAAEDCDGKQSLVQNNQI
ncbi:MAG: epoxyqueuosine reductase QueH [Clostridia bacterium]|nr:epoxyqueuosine reductase QueH [Clostridia bacterium]